MSACVYYRWNTQGAKTENPRTENRYHTLTKKINHPFVGFIKILCARKTGLVLFGYDSYSYGAAACLLARRIVWLIKFICLVDIFRPTKQRWKLPMLETIKNSIEIEMVSFFSLYSLACQTPNFQANVIIEETSERAVRSVWTPYA